MAHSDVVQIRKREADSRSDRIPVLVPRAVLGARVARRLFDVAQKARVGMLGKLHRGGSATLCPGERGSQRQRRFRLLVELVLKLPA